MSEPSPLAAPGVPVCGIGASAGGVEALQHFFRDLPSDLGLAYIVIIHLLAGARERAAGDSRQVDADARRAGGGSRTEEAARRIMST